VFFMRRLVAVGIVMASLVAPSLAQEAPDPNRPLTTAEIRELLDAAKATAKASRENVDYVRVLPDILYQVLVKIDKLEDKLDKIEESLKRSEASRRRAR
jgi:hypothetical protein